MRRYLYFISADPRQLQRRLERLAGQGLELTGLDGLFTGEFARTGRQDLRYLTVPYGQAMHFPRTGDFRSFGWELMGGFNGMAIFKSLPLTEPDTKGTMDKLEEDGCVHRDRWTVPVVAALLVLCGVFLLLWPWAPFTQPLWSSYLALGAHLVRWVILLLAAANLVGLVPSAVGAWIHGLTPIVFLAALGVGVLAFTLDMTATPLRFLVIPLLLALALLLALWRSCKPLATVSAAICLLVLLLGLLFPNVSQTSLSGRTLHNSVADQPVLSLADLGDEGSLTGSGYDTEGTFLVRQTSYWEMTDDATVSSQVCRCLTPGLARQAARWMMRTGTWTETDYGWANGDHTAVVLLSGCRAARLTWSSPFDETALAAARQELF